MGTAEIVQRAIDYIEQHLNEPLEVEQIAEAAAMSVPNLYRMFYAVTGHPIVEYIRRRRTSEAASYLRQSKLTILDVGFRSGFESYPAFTNTFKRLTGVTPGQYRQSCLIYSFERINLNEQLAYVEERELSERFSDVRVIKLSPQQATGYLHSEGSEKALEAAAMERFRKILAQYDLDIAKLRIFGWNVDLVHEPQTFGYQLAAVGELTGGSVSTSSLLQPIVIPGGLYATTRTQASESRIVSGWNRLLSEWLPRSTFEPAHPNKKAQSRIK